MCMIYLDFHKMHYFICYQEYILQTNKHHTRELLLLIQVIHYYK